MKKLQLLIVAAAAFAVTSSVQASHIFNYNLRIDGQALADSNGNRLNPNIYDADGIVNVTWSTAGDSFGGGDTESYSFSQTGGTLSNPNGGSASFFAGNNSYSQTVNFGTGGTWTGSITMDSAVSFPNYSYDGVNDQDTTPSFGFSLTTGESVPDAGSTVGLLGLAATTLGALNLRRKKS